LSASQLSDPPGVPASQLSKVPVRGLGAPAVIENFGSAGFPGVAVSFVYHKSHQSVDGLPLTSSSFKENETLRNILT
jgi:hypothetical protein